MSESEPNANQSNHSGSPESIFHHARAIPAPDRDRYLDEACLGNLELVAKVKRLLKADAEASDFLDTADIQTATDPPLSGMETQGNQIGHYKLLDKIGEGGFGSVWMAEQREPIKRRVALKIIKLGMDTKQVIARFEAERQALALMDHPNIAKVYDGGSTDTGRPYFVMEYIRGVPIFEFCDTERLNTTERLSLFIHVCNALQHAHQKGIIHRDIKPSNVLVTLHDGVPVPKVIDFGIAKATNQELTDKTLFTQHRQMIGTPAYMSPEQAEMSGLDIDTRSDIYSLGVLLYELLTGTTPLSNEDLMSKGFAEMMNVIRDTVPQKPSTRLNTLGNAAVKTTARGHATDSSQLSSLMKGDLDWIAMKCLEKDRARRYETANALAADIRRHLDNQPVEAGPPSARYRMSKLIKRNKGAVAAGILITAALIVGFIGTTLGLLAALDARSAEAAQRRLVEDRFQSAMQYVERMSDEVLLEVRDMIGGTNATESLTRATTEFLDSLAIESADSPELRYLTARTYLRQSQTLGHVFAANTIGDFQGALDAAQRSIEILKTLPDDFPDIKTRFETEWFAWDAIAIAYGMLDEPEKSVEAYLKLEQYTEHIENQYPEVLAENSMLGLLNLRIGHAYSRVGQYEVALERYQARINSELATDLDLETCTERQIHERSISHVILSRAFANVGRYDEAFEHSKLALDVTETKFRRWPNNARFARDLVNANSRYALAAAQIGRSGLVEEHTTRAIVAGKDLVERDPSNASFIWDYLGSIEDAGDAFLLVSARGTIDERMNSLTKSIAYFTDIIEFKFDPSMTENLEGESMNSRMVGISEKRNTARDSLHQLNTSNE